MSMPAMGAENDIFFAEVRTNPHRDRFLPDVSMTGSVNQSLLMAASELLFAAADQEHPSEHFQEGILTDLGFNCCHGLLSGLCSAR